MSDDNGGVLERSGVDLLVVDNLSGDLMPALNGQAVATAPATLPTEADVRRRLRQWETKYAFAKSAATVKAVRADWGILVSWCERAKRPLLPMSKDDLVTFLQDMGNLGKKHATVARYVQTINTIHAAAHLPSPTKHPEWKLEWEGIVRTLSTSGRRAPKQAEPLTTSKVQQILSSLGTSALDLRDAALITLASDTLCRESELVALQIEDIQPSGQAWIVDLRRSKTDQEGLGDSRYCSPATKRRIDAWCAAAGITSGFLFRPVGRARSVNASDIGMRGAIKAPEVARIIRRRAIAAGVDGGARMSGHSGRVASAIEMLEQGASVTAVQYAGGWKGERMVLHYGKRALAGRNAMAELRQAQNSEIKSDTE